MQAYVSDWSQELYGDFRNYAVPGADLADAPRRAQRLPAARARAGAGRARRRRDGARAFLEHAYSPLANAAWQYDTAFGWTAVPVDQMQHYVSAQIYALRSAARGGAGPRRLRLGAEEPRGHAAATSRRRPARCSTASRRRSATRARRTRRIQAAVPVPEGSGAAARSTAAGSTSGWTSFAEWKPSALAFTTGAAVAHRRHASSGPIAIELRTWSGVPARRDEPARGHARLDLRRRSLLDGADRAVDADARDDRPDRQQHDERLLLRHDRGQRHDHGHGARQGGRHADRDGLGRAARVADAVPALARPCRPAARRASPRPAPTRTATSSRPTGSRGPLAPGTPGTVAATSADSALFTAGPSGGTGAVVATANGVSGQAAVTVEAPATARVSSVETRKLRRRPADRGDARRRRRHGALGRGRLGRDRPQRRPLHDEHADDRQGRQGRASSSREPEPAVTRRP